VLMENHYHLLLRTRQGNLSRAIQWLGVSYTTWFNRRHERSGHLFQGRFKSFLIEDDRYFNAMCFYIHGNPVRAGIVEEPEAYQWSSARAYADREACAPWLTTGVVLELSGGSRRKFCAEQSAYIWGQASPLSELRYGIYLGSGGYAETCRRMAAQERSGEKPQVRLLRRLMDKAEAAEKIIKRLHSVSSDHSSSARKQSQLQRDMCIYIMSRMGIYTNRRLGSILESGIQR